MEKWRETLIAEGSSILETIERIDKSGSKIALVVDKEGRLRGTVTDGDIRRAFLRGQAPTDSINQIMNQDPKVCSGGTSIEELIAEARRLRIGYIPLVDPQKRVIGLFSLSSIIEPEKIDNQVIVMAGGRGERLRPLTDHTPKPMLKINGEPLLEKLLKNLVSQGFSNILFSVNYRADHIRSYFGEGSRWGAKIGYIEEQSRLGTAGSLGLLDKPPTKPILVVNGDLLLQLSFRNLLAFHSEQNADATVCARNYALQVPFGVLNCDGHKIQGISEKPIMNQLIAAGVYVLNPSCIESIQGKDYLDMPQLLENLLGGGATIVKYILEDYWLDVGRPEDYKQASIDMLRESSD